MAQRMMAEYEVAETDLQFGGERALMDEREVDDRDRIRQNLSVAVARFCQCEVWSRGGYGLTFCGLESDVIFAHWLLDTLADFVKRELLKHLARISRPGITNRRVETKGFVAGCTSRICARLSELSHRGHGTGSSRALVVAKNALIRECMKQHGIIVKQRRSRRSVDAGAYHAGLSAGDGARFDRPVNGGNKPLAIGR
jgi:hypothetical protein